MPYSSEYKEKVTKQDNASNVFQRCSQDGGDVSPSDEGEGFSARNNSFPLFAFIREAHLEEAQEFRLKGYNSQVPEVDGGLLTQLRDDLTAAKPRLCVQVSVGGPLGSLWLLEQIGNIELLTSTLSDDVIKRWIEHELPRKSDGEATEAALGSRRTAQSLARRLESTLQTLIRVVRTLRAMDDYSTPEKRDDMLDAEITGVFSSYDKSTVIQALGSMTAEASGNAAWASLMQARKAAWEAGKSSSVNAMIAASRHEAEKANKKARQLQGDPQTFFSHVAACLQSLSSDLAKASIHAGLSTIPPTLQHDEVVASLSRSNSLSQRIKTGFDKKKLQAQIAVAGMKVHAHRLVRIAQHGHPTGTPIKAPEHVVADSVIRSILWQWQQPAIKIQYASAALLSKVDELKKIEGVLAAYSAADGRESDQERRNTPVSEDLVAQVREWVSDSLEQENPENQRAVKVATLERLLGGDIASARGLVERLGNTGESIQNMLKRQRLAVLKMIVNLLSDVSPSLKAVDELLPDIAGDLTASIVALDKAQQAATYATRDFSEAKTQAENAQLLASKVKERLSAESARLTERPLDDHSRGARLARHWANLASAQNEGNNPPPDARQVLASLKAQGLLAGTLSAGDPAGYLFATRLAGELENARHDELRLPVSPEQYAALEKGLVEYIVKWGQKRIPRGGTRIVIELSFEQALNAVSFNVSGLFRLPYKVLKASIKIPYNVNKVNNYTMPGHDKPYKAIYGLLGKKLKQLGFNLLTAPVPGAVKLAAGAGLTAGAALHNMYVGRSENTFSAVYQHMAEGTQSEKIKMGSVGGMVFDAVLDTATTAAFKGGQSAWQSGRSENNAISGNAFVSKQAAVSNEETPRQAQKMATGYDNPAQENAAVDEREDVPVIHDSPLQSQTDAEPLSDEHDPGINQPHKIRKRAAEWNINGRRITFPPSLDGEDRLFLNPKRNYAMFALKWVNQNNTEVADWVTNPDVKTYTQLNTKDWGVIDVRYNEEEGAYETSDNRVINDYITQLAKITILSEDGLDDELESLIIENENVEYGEYIKRFNSTFSDENVKKIKTEKQEQEENRKKDERLRGEAKKSELNRSKKVVKKKHYDDSVEMYLKGREGNIVSAAEKSSWPSEIQIPHTSIKVSLISVINGDVPKDIVATLVKPDMISDDEWQDIISGKLYDEIKSETDSQDEEFIRVEEFITKVEGVIKDIQGPEEYIKQWIRDNSNLEPDDTYTFHITHPLLDKFKRNEKVYKNQIREFKKRDPDKTKTVTIYDIVTGKVNYDLNPTRSTNVKVDMPGNSEVFNLYSRRDEAISGYEKYLDEINTRHAKDIDNYFTLSNKLNGGEMHKTSAWFDKLKEHLDKVTYTETEIEVDFGLRVTGEVIGAAGYFSPLSPLKDFIFITGSQIGINLLQAENASSPEEKEMYREAARKTAIYGAILSIPGIIGSKPASKVGSFIKQKYRHTVNSNISKVSKPVMDIPRVTQPATTYSGAKSQHFWSDKEGSYIPVSKLRKKFNAEAGMPGRLQLVKYSPRKFRIGKTDLLGKINGRKFYISLDNGVTWVKGNKIHLLAYRLQNSGGRSKSVQLNGRIYRNHNAVSSQAQELNSIKSNNYDIFSLEPDSTATAAKQGARRDFEAGVSKYNYDEFNQFDSLSLSKKIEGLQSGTLEGQTLTHRQKGALWNKAHDQFWEDQARRQIIRGQGWVNSAKKNYNATGGEVSPQGAYLRGKNQGECESATILMARAQREGRGSELARSLTGLFDEPDNALGASLGRLRSQSGIKGEVMAGVRLSALETSELTLFPGSTDEAISVRLELKERDSGIRNHVVLLSRRKGDSGNYIYSFFDPNYGYVEFSKYNYMANFVKKRVQIKNKAKGGYENSDEDVEFSTVSNQKLDAATHTLRLINPTSSSRSGYFPPIKLNKNKHQSLQTHEPSTASSVPNLPASTPQRQINYNLTSDIDAAAYLEELKQNPRINNKIMNPAGQCESLMNPVSDFMKDKGFDNIRYRGMFIWNNATEQIPMNHFAVVGNKGGKDYVFDISAHQFESKGMGELNGPLILSAEEWGGKYSGATKRKLIYYTDFSNSRAAANTYNALPRELESESKSMVVKVFVTSPTWYNTFKKQKNMVVSH